jgi:hypothetical protein
MPKITGDALYKRGGSCHRGGYQQSKGWALRAPKKGTERHTLMNKCKSKCFLLPHTEGFPVCTLNCRFDCGGILAAYRRAMQYKHPRVAAAARSLAKGQKCSWIH